MRSDLLFIEPGSAQVRGHFLAQTTHQLHQRFVADQAGDFIDQQVGQQVIVAREQLPAMRAEAIQLLGAAASGAQIAAHHQAVTFQGRQVLAHSRAGDRQLAGQFFDAHAGSRIQQG
ncbi:hypothetical protein D3C73_1337410 [compost metagenome]